MKKSEFKGLKEAELKDKLIIEKDALQRLKFGHAISPIENPSKINKARKLVAKLNTEIRAKQLSK